ncbi:bitesize isoform 4-T4 [Glossina fuscipes fuscipes]
MIMSSGRSARLPPTPNAPNNKQWAVTNNATVSSSSALLSTASGSLREPNSNNVMNSYNISNSITTRINMTPIIGISSGAVVGDGSSVDGDGGGLINRVDVATEGIPGETIDALGPELAVATSQVLENLTENERKMIIEVLNRDENVRQRDATRIMLLRAELLSLRRKGALKIGGALVGNGSSTGVGVSAQHYDSSSIIQQHQHQHQQQQQLHYYHNQQHYHQQEQYQHQQQLQQQQQQQHQQQQYQVEHNNHNRTAHPAPYESNRHCARCNIELGRITNRGAPCRVCKLRVCKACREFTTRTTDWVCVVCHKQMEIQAASRDWLGDLTQTSSDSVGDHLPTSDVLRKSIRRSWTISNADDDPNNPNAQNPVANNLYPQQQNLIEGQTAGSFPSLIVRHHSPRNHPMINYNTGSATTIAGNIGTNQTPPPFHVHTQRRILRQSTLPTTLPNNELNLRNSGSNPEHYNNVNLTAPTSPHQLHQTPFYSGDYNSDDVLNIEISSDCDNYAQAPTLTQTPQLIQQTNIVQSSSVINTPTHHRLQVRRQSTLPANPLFMSTSPNRAYSRSPERSPGEQQRYPPFVRQTSFPCNLTEPQVAINQTSLHLGSTSISTYPSPMHRTKMLPSTVNQPQPPTHYQEQYDQTINQPDESNILNKPRIMRQATLPNPEQHIKLLPTSPPKRQTSPQYRRSPEFMRQQTLPNPEAFSSNSLTVQGPANPASQAKFLPISPLQKQNFLFPNVQNPRQFLSQQNVPAVDGADPVVGGTGDQYSSSQSVNIHHSRDHNKMMKVRSHSNEEYSITKSHHLENRRLLPEIPTAGRSMNRSPSRLVRQDCLKDDRGTATHGDHRTFGEAKQQFHQFQNVTEEDDNRPEYMDYFGDSSSSFLESDEVQYEKNYNTGFSSEPRIIYNDGSDDASYQPYQRPMVHSAENMMTVEQNYIYYGPEGDSLGANLTASAAGVLPRTPIVHNRLRRRQSRDLPMPAEELSQISGAAETQQPAISVAVDEKKPAEKFSERPKPEQMRSVSEDSGSKDSIPKPMPRRSLSHPEKETQTSKKVEPTKIPSPKPLADILDKTRPISKIPTSTRRRSSRGSITNDVEDGGNLKYYVNEKRNSELSAITNNKPLTDEIQQQKQQQLDETSEKRTEHPITEKANNLGTTEQQQHGNKIPEDEEKKSNDSNTKDNQRQQEEQNNNNNDNDREGRSLTVAKQTYTSTLGEQEIQNAVEAAAVIFKKVVLQRRQEKKAAEEEEAKAAAEELNRSPVMDHSGIDPSASPLQSRGSGSSDAWHGQSDEDIDRLVAMHQNRSSLSSLGLRSDSMASVYSGAGEGRYGTVVVKGQVEFGMQYNYKLAALEIHVVRCKDLAAVDSKRNRSDPYVKVYLLPDKSKAGKRKTKVKKHTLNPIFDEVLRFHMPIASLEARTLWLTVWHSDMFGRNDFLGEVSVNLQGRVFDNPQSQWYLLQERSEPFDEVATYRGDIVVGLKYVTPESTKSTFMRSGSIVSGMGSGLRKFGSIKSVSTSKAERTAKGGQLHVLVKEAKHLTPIKPNGCCDAFCKSYLLPDRTRSSKQKTPVVKRSNNPSWTYTFIYEDVSLEDLSERALELTVWDHDRLASNEFLGGVRFSLGTGKSYGRQVDWMDASGKELSLWQNMLDRPNFWVEGSLVLRSTLDGIRITP